MKVYILIGEPMYEGGGSYMGTREILGVFNSYPDLVKLGYDEMDEDITVEEYEVS